jgi:hypothetical protein
MRRLIRQTLVFLALSVGLLARHSNTNPSDPGNTGDFKVNDTATGGQRTVTGILTYAGGKFKDGRVRELRDGPTNPRDRKTNDNDNDWSQIDPKYQPKYADLDEHGRATGMSITMNNDVREAMKHDTDPTKSKKIPPGYDSDDHQKGHLLGAQFGGSNRDARNFTPLYDSVNSPKMRGVENQVAAYMKANPNEDVTYSVTPNYEDPPSTNGVPTSVTMTLTDSSGNPIPLEYPKGTPNNTVTIPNDPPA